jgi:hypothetical protein
MQRPFTWSNVKRETLARLPADFRLPAEAPPNFLAGIQRCCARLLALCGNGDLVFVGRSPESLYDYLSGVLHATSWQDRCWLLSYSNRYTAMGRLLSHRPEAVHAMREQLRWFRLAPDQLRVRGPVTFVDLVSEGSTFGNLVDFLLGWAREEGADLPSIRQKLHFVGITYQQKTSPKTWRWQQQVPWARQFRPSAMKNVSLPGRLWRYLGNEQDKVFRSHSPPRWTDTSAQLRSRFGTRTAAQQVALYLHQQGRDRAQRDRLLRLMAAGPGVRLRWLRELMGEIRGLS